jgi:hypothetical protein
MALQSQETFMKGTQDALMSGLQADADVIYQKEVDGSERPGLKARVIYDDMGAALKGTPLGLNRIMVIMYSDAVRGISLNDDGPIIGDAIWVAPAPGVDPKWCTILKRIRANNNMITWEVR